MLLKASIDAVAEQTKKKILLLMTSEAAVAENLEDDNGAKESNEVVANNPYQLK